MRLGMLIMSIGGFGKSGFYNSQEVGLAKELNKYAEEIIIYRLVSKGEKYSSKVIDGYDIVFESIPANSIGTNGMLDTSILDETLDVLICFSDTQLYFPKAFRWARKNNIVFIPYVGVIDSHSDSIIKKTISNFIVRRNINISKRCSNLCKTPYVAKKLSDCGINDLVIAPVGLDMDLVNRDYFNTTSVTLKEKYGYSQEDKVVLFVGRLTEEKQPIRMLDIFKALFEKDGNYKLIMVGDGELQSQIEEKIAEYRIDNAVRLIKRIPNSDMWELYRLSDVFVNLNMQEIFGMCILEAMYYECNVVAWNAPGPDYIIEDGDSGWIVNNDMEVIDKVLNLIETGEKAHERIINSFTWRASAEQIIQCIEKSKEHS